MKENGPLIPAHPLDLPHLYFSYGHGINTPARSTFTQSDETALIRDVATLAAEFG